MQNLNFSLFRTRTESKQDRYIVIYGWSRRIGLQKCCFIPDYNIYLSEKSKKYKLKLLAMWCSRLLIQEFLKFHVLCSQPTLPGTAILKTITDFCSFAVSSNQVEKSVPWVGAILQSHYYYQDWKIKTRNGGERDPWEIAVDGGRGQV